MDSISWVALLDLAAITWWFFFSIVSLAALALIALNLRTWHDK